MRSQISQKWRVPVMAAMLIPVAAIVIACVLYPKTPPGAVAQRQAAPATELARTATEPVPASDEVLPAHTADASVWPKADHFILPRVARDEPCEIVMDADNEPNCWNRFAYDPYFIYGKETLWTLMRQGDAKAATVLSYKLRMSDPSTSFFYAVIAAQRSSKAGPLALYLERGSLGYNFKEHRVVDPDQALRSYQAFVIAEELGYSYSKTHSAEQFRALLRKTGIPDQYLDAARDQGLELLIAHGEA